MYVWEPNIMVTDTSFGTWKFLYIVEAVTAEWKESGQKYVYLEARHHFCVSLLTQILTYLYLPSCQLERERERERERDGRVW